jgi:hypothetical protein
MGGGKWAMGNEERLHVFSSSIFPAGFEFCWEFQANLKPISQTEQRSSLSALPSFTPRFPGTWGRRQSADNCFDREHPWERTCATENMPVPMQKC